MSEHTEDFGLDVTVGCTRDLYGRTFRLRRVDARQDREEVCPRCRGTVTLHFEHGSEDKGAKVTTDAGHFVLRQRLAFQLFPQEVL